MRIKILHVGKFYPPYHGGMETHLETLCVHLRPHVDIKVLVSNSGRKTTQEIRDGIPVTRAGALGHIASTSINPSLVNHIRTSDADIVHLHWPNPGAVAAYWASGHKGRLVVTYHSDVVRQRILGRMFEPALDYTLRRSEAIIATSPNYVASSPVLARHASKCRIVPLGIPAEHFDAPDPRAVKEIQQRYGDRLVLSVGRLVSYKGMDTLVRAMAKIKGRLLIAGTGPLGTSLRELAADLGVSDKVVFLGSPTTAELRNYYHAADIFAIASNARSEAFGIVQVEAMAAGKPVVNMNIDSGVPYVSQHNRTGLSVDPGDVSGIANAIAILLDNADCRRTFGQAARERAQKLFTAETMAARTLDIYRDILGINGVSHSSHSKAPLYNGCSAL